MSDKEFNEGVKAFKDGLHCYRNNPYKDKMFSLPYNEYIKDPESIKHNHWENGFHTAEAKAAQNKEDTTIKEITERVGLTLKDLQFLKKYFFKNLKEGIVYYEEE